LCSLCDFVHIILLRQLCLGRRGNKRGYCNEIETVGFSCGTKCVLHRSELSCITELVTITASLQVITKHVAAAIYGKTMAVA
jgi:hypothetical protein